MEFNASMMEEFLKKNPALSFLADSLSKSGFERSYALKIIFNAYVFLHPENLKIYLNASDPS